MPEHLLDDFHVGPAGDRQAGGGVPELVRVEIRDPDDARGRPEGRAERADPQRLAVADASEDEVIWCFVGHVVGQLGDQEAGDRHFATIVGLGGAPHQPLSLNRRHGLGDDGTVALQVQPGDAQCGHLSESHSGVGQEEHDEPVGLVGASVEAAELARPGRVAGCRGQVIDLVVGQVAVLVLDGPRQVDSGGHVADQPAVLDREVEHQAEHAMDLVDGGGGV
ncbi:hypothetical protein KDN32_06330 [Nocardioides sp. J2M5]|nr:hypothetical protein [Nocardioides palaemonis]MBS2937353.1 hypothetical protein [Nocardioides palaemonis]